MSKLDYFYQYVDDLSSSEVLANNDTWRICGCNRRFFPWITIISKKLTRLVNILWPKTDIYDVISADILNQHVHSYEE